MSEYYGYAFEAMAAARESGQSSLSVSFDECRGWRVDNGSPDMGASGAAGGTYGGSSTQG